jgi:F-type H+-transporting ATPase subunit epsilon
VSAYRLKILNSEQTFFDGDVTSSVLSGGLGLFGVLGHHAPLISTLSQGPLRFTDTQGKTRRYTTEGGVVEVGHNTATLYIDSHLTEI